MERGKDGVKSSENEEAMQSLSSTGGTPGITKGNVKVEMGRDEEKGNLSGKG